MSRWVLAVVKQIKVVTLEAPLTKLLGEFYPILSHRSANQETVLALQRSQDPTTSDEPSQWNSFTGRWVRHPVQ
jgi:hypothetical protein